MAHLLVTLAVDPRGILVTWRLDRVAFDAGEPLGQLPLSIAGAPTLQLEGAAVAATDGVGPVPLATSLTESDDGEWLGAPLQLDGLDRHPRTPRSDWRRD